MAGATVIPASYVFDQATGTGAYSYSDRTGSELTDGMLGRGGTSINLGSGTAAEWVGWQSAEPVNIDFTFSGLTAVSSVHVGSTQHDPQVKHIMLPSLQVYQWQNGWQLAGSVTVRYDRSIDFNSLSFLPHPFIDLANLDIVSDRVRLSLIPNGRWTFVDEVLFNGEAVAAVPLPVPEPVPLALMGLGLGLMGWIRHRRAR